MYIVLSSTDVSKCRGIGFAELSQGEEYVSDYKPGWNSLKNLAANMAFTKAFLVRESFGMVPKRIPLLLCKHPTRSMMLFVGDETSTV